MATALIPLGGTAVATTDHSALGPLPSYRQVSSCVEDRPAAPTVRHGVSPAQESLGFTRLWTLVGPGDRGRGEGILVAVIDTGVNPTGGAFGNRLRPGADLIDPSTYPPGLIDCDGHGTLVAGLIAAQPDPRTGFSGVAPAATILSIRQTSLAYAPDHVDAPDDDPSRSSTAGHRKDDAAPTGQDGDSLGGAGDSDTLAAAILLAAKAQARVINVSAAECGPAGKTRSAALEAAVETATHRYDAVVVAAAGNLGSAPDCAIQNRPGAVRTRAIPAAYDDVLTVGSVDADGTPSDFSLAGPWVDVAAPGVGIIATNPSGAAGGQVRQLSTAEGPVPLAGTSFSAAYVSGVVALVRARYPRLSAPEVVRRIRVTARRPAGPAPTSGLDLVSVQARAASASAPSDAGVRTGYALGAGVINPRSALTTDIAGQNTLPGSVRTVPSTIGILADGRREPRREPAADTRAALFGGGGVALLVCALTARRMRRRTVREPGSGSAR